MTQTLQILLRSKWNYSVVLILQDTQRNFQGSKRKARVCLFFFFFLYLRSFSFSEVQTNQSMVSQLETTFLKSECVQIAWTLKSDTLHKAKQKHAKKSETSSRLNSVSAHVGTAYKAFYCICVPVSKEPAFIVTIEILTHLSLMKEHSPRPTSGHPPATNTEMK